MVVPVKQDGGGGEGLKAKSSASCRRSTSNMSVTSKKSSVTGMAFGGGRSGKYKCDSTLYNTKRASGNTSVKSKGGKSTKTTKTSASGMSFGGKSLSADGKARAETAVNSAALPVLTTTANSSIGGSLAFSQLDAWMDNGLNERASCDLWVASGSAINGDLDCRVSSTNKKVLVVTLELSITFTNLDEKLRYLLDRINIAYDCKGDLNACLRILQNHSRYISAKVNLKDLLGKSGRFLVEHRITAPFEIDEALVMADEDAIFYGYQVIEDEETGETHIHFELKRAGVPFNRVAIEGTAAQGAAYAHTPATKKSMFSTGSTQHSGSDSKMDAIPENISFSSPQAKRPFDDDNSTIKTKQTMATMDRYKHQPADEESFRGAAGVPPNGDDEASWDDNLMDESDEDSVDPEVEDLRKQVNNLTNIVNGIYQARTASADSGDTPSTAASTAKKTKTNTGSAASVSGASRRSSNSRGSSRSQQRKKASANPSSNFFFNPGKKMD